MGPSRGTGPVRARTRRVVVGVLVIAALVLAALLIASRAAVFSMLENHFGSGFDERRFTAMGADFARDRASFAAAEARMHELVLTHPRAVRIGWTLRVVCIRDEGQSGQGDDCQQTSSADQTLFAALPNADAVLYQAKDLGRTFFRFYVNDPPMYTVMHAPADASPQTYAEDRGFRGLRALETGWTVLGPIPDDVRWRSQWLQ